MAQFYIDGMIRKLRVICRLYYTSGVEKDEDSESSNHGDSSSDDESVGQERQWTWETTRIPTTTMDPSLGSETPFLVICTV